MNHYWSENYIGTAVIALLLSGIIMPQILMIAFRRNLFDEHGGRKIHQGAVPRLGGFAFLPSIIFSLFLVIGISLEYGVPMMNLALGNSITAMLFLVCGLMLIFLVGMGDDLVGVKYRAKFAMQIIVSLMLVCGGAVFLDFEGLFGLGRIPFWLGVVFSVLVIVYLVNAFNLIDGIDGLASGLSMIGLVWYGLMFHLAGRHIYAMLAWSGFGTLLPFFYYNYFGDARKRNKIFMGDTGSLTVGTIIAFLALSLNDLGPVGDVSNYNPLICAFSPLIIPGFDVIRVYFHRVRNGRNPFLPDKCHIHHKLLALGMSTRRALAVILLAAVAFLLANVVVSQWVNATWVFVGDLVLWTGMNIIMTHCIRRREARTGLELYV